MSKINVTIRISMSQEEVDITLPVTATASQIINKLIGAGLGISKVDESGDPYVYDLIHKASASRIGEDQMLEETKVRDGDILILSQDLVAA